MRNTECKGFQWKQEQVIVAMDMIYEIATGFISLFGTQNEFSIVSAVSKSDYSAFHYCDCFLY